MTCRELVWTWAWDMYKVKLVWKPVWIHADSNIQANRAVHAAVQAEVRVRLYVQRDDLPKAVLLGNGPYPTHSTQWGWWPVQVDKISCSERGARTGVRHRLIHIGSKRTNRAVYAAVQAQIRVRLHLQRDNIPEAGAFVWRVDFVLLKAHLPQRSQWPPNQTPLWGSASTTSFEWRRTSSSLIISNGDGFLDAP